MSTRQNHLKSIAQVSLFDLHSAPGPEFNHGVIRRKVRTRAPTHHRISEIQLLLFDSRTTSTRGMSWIVDERSTGGTARYLSTTASPFVQATEFESEWHIIDPIECRRIIAAIVDEMCDGGKQFTHRHLFSEFERLDEDISHFLSRRRDDHSKRRFEEDLSRQWRHLLNAYSYVHKGQHQTDVTSIVPSLMKNSSSVRIDVPGCHICCNQPAERQYPVERYGLLRWCEDCRWFWDAAPNGDNEF